MFRVIDEKHGVFDVVFLAEFSQEAFGHDGRSRREQPYMQEFVGIGIDGGGQPELLAVDADHRLGERDVIRTRLTGRL
jgi:hypothetical protein